MDIDVALDRIQNNKGVLGIIILDSNKKIIRNTLDRKLTEKYASIMPDLSLLARNCIRNIDPQNELNFYRIRSLQYEIMVAPKNDFDIIVIQDASIRVD